METLNKNHNSLSPAGGRCHRGEVSQGEVSQGGGVTLGWFTEPPALTTSNKMSAADQSGAGRKRERFSHFREREIQERGRGGGGGGGEGGGGGGEGGGGGGEEEVGGEEEEEDIKVQQKTKSRR